MDRLKETYPDLPEVSDKTVYNFVMAVREAFSLPREKEEVRQMSKLPDPAYGREAQVDWGEKNMMTTTGRWKKVYFFVMVMSRSRKKFVYFHDIPFTSRMTAYAHHLAFDGGVSWIALEKKADYQNIDDVAVFTYELFKAMGVLEEFISKGHKAISYMNSHQYLAHR